MNKLVEPVKVKEDEDAGGEHPTHPGGPREVGRQQVHAPANKNNEEMDNSEPYEDASE